VGQNKLPNWANSEYRNHKLNRAIEALGDTVGHAVINLTKANRQGKHKISAASRASMAAAQKARWAKLKAPAEPAKAPANKPTTPFVPPKKKYTLSPEARANISAGAKARWVRIKSGK
jgi:hypothetical protein